MKRITFIMIALSLMLAMTGCNKKPETQPSDSPKAEGQTDNAVENKGDSASSNSQDEGVFKFTVNSDVDVDGNNPKLNAEQLEIAINIADLGGKYPIRYDLDCDGDGEFEQKDLDKSARCDIKRHSGRHQIGMRGEFPAIKLCMLDDEVALPDNASAVESIDSWGNIEWKSMHAFAMGCAKLNRIPEKAPDLSKVTDMSSMFYGASAFNQPLEAWDTSNVTNMSGLFGKASSFNQPLNKWKTSKVTDMSGMFFEASAFNQPLEAWDTSNVTVMSSMFTEATSFNQPLEKWDTSNVTRMNLMFWGAKSFNQPVEKWNTSKVTDMSGMFWSATSFDQHLNSWYTKSVCDMSLMFNEASSFSHYPVDWVVPAKGTKDMFVGTKVEQMAKDQPLKLVDKPECKYDDEDKGAE